ncbi:SsrA-binding protein [Alphaproteobacteria bacterium]|nr:SsrA-binding protein [Alphaproteobacteria bacterium]
MKKPKNEPKSIVNRRAHYDYALEDELIVGLVLTGAEAKAARNGHVQLKGSYVTVNNNELWLINASFSVASNERGGGRSVDSRSRKLLAHRKQINKLVEAKNSGLTIVPIKMLTAGRHIKIIIATGRGKKQYDKREAIKKRDIEREARRAHAL